MPQPDPVTFQQPTEAMPPRFDARLKLLFSALFVPNAIYLSFFPLWLEGRGLTAVEISTLLTLPVFVRLLITPVVTQIADNARERADVLIVISGVSALIMMLFLIPVGYPVLLALVMLLSAFWSPQVPIADSVALSGVRRFGSDYASIRIWGSGLFLIVNIAAGIIIERTSPDWAVPMMIAGFIGIFAVTFATPRLGMKRQKTGGILSSWQILKDRRVLLILIATGLIQASHGLMYNFGSIYWKSLGVSAQQVGFLWAIPVFSEIVLFRLYARLFKSWTPQSVLALAGIVAIVRWILFAAAPDIGMGFFSFALVQCLHALTFGATYLAQQTYLAHAVAEERAGAAQGIGVLVHGIIMVAVMFASGPLYAALGGYSFLAMIFVAFAGIVAAFGFAASAKLGQPTTSAP
jgi:MFS transporter, PPP family, 3-phenylpropionic acid transporter